ncbi:hypothetical protein [uncultured Psychroserpens sp.]|uniref:hypothetical protein n=1 Tax=uncultured Psychroserpens sp. TaxID=255436 RepID=UPI00262A951C|nr:hypothetical protein [uncultured Psychroserpens sp.]
MKYFLSFLLVLSSIIVNAQDVVGTYELQSNSNDSSDFELKRILTLNSNGTFEYYNYRRVKRGIPPETHTYGKGTWKRENKVIIFTTAQSDMDDKFTLNFTGTKARFISKSPRDKSDRIIKTALSFYESEIFWIKGMKLLKKEITL